MDKCIVINNSFYPLTKSYRVYYTTDIRQTTKDKAIHRFYFSMDDSRSLLLSGNAEQENEKAKDILKKVYEIIDQFLHSEEKSLDLKDEVMVKALKNTSFEYQVSDRLKMKVLSLVLAYLLSL